MSADLVIADTGPLIGLARIGQLDLLRSLWKRVVVPETVWAEAVTEVPDAPGAEQIRVTRSWIEIENADPALVAPIALVLDQGEAEALALAKTHSESILLVDDLRARKLAERLGVAVRGTVGVLLMAKRAGLLENIEDPVRRLEEVGLFLSESLIRDVLRRAGET